MVRILIVDDDPDVRELVRYELETRDWEVTEAATAAEVAPALAAAPDLILLDLCLPDQDGLALAARLRATSAIPIIMLTGLGGDVDRIVGLEMGADDYVVKPFNPRELVALTNAEFLLLEAFVRAPRCVLSRDQLLERTRTDGGEVFDRTIDVLILRLRRKIEPNPRAPQLIRTERGMGYVLDAEVRRL